MFALHPDNEENKKSLIKRNLIFFGKLGLYFVAVRASYVYFGADLSIENDNSNL